jgi:exonuclease SbcC
MIPQRIQLSGFLSYKEPQTLDFTGAPLWMLSGHNGSGKSSVFDAVTYALFGHHRGGGSNAGELINKESSSFNVEFDFRLDHRDYRIKRTLRRAKTGTQSGTQQIFAWANGEWAAIPDTTKKVDFDRWIHEKIGLDYETFTSSVLLLQGNAEKLIGAKDRDRAEVLAGIVDLERYQQLHERANRQKIDLKAHLDNLNVQAAGVPEVSDEDYAAALAAIAMAEAAKQDAQEKIDACLNIEAQAKRWAEANARSLAARQKLAAAEKLLGDAVAIEKAHARVLELRDVLPAVNTVVTARSQNAESERRAAAHAKTRDDAQERRQKLEHDLEVARKSKANQQRDLKADEEQYTQVNVRLRELAAEVSTVEMMEKQDIEWKRLSMELERLPPKPEEQLAKAQEQVERLTELARVLPILERVQTERHDRQQAQIRAKEAEAERDRIKKEGEGEKAKQDRQRPELEQARTLKIETANAVAVAKSMEAQAFAAQRELETFAGKASCQHCGQPLTPEHMASETARRSVEFDTARKKHQKAIAEAQAAAAREQELADEDAARTEKLRVLREQYQEKAAEAKTAAAEVERLTKSLDLRYAEMPPEYQKKIALKRPSDWNATHYPERDELLDLRREAAQLDPAKRAIREAQQVLDTAKDLRTRIASTEKTLATLRVHLPEHRDLPSLRKEHAQAKAQEIALANQIKALKKTLETTEREIDKLGQEAYGVAQHLTELRGKLETEAVTQKHCSETIERALKALPEAWRAKAANAGLRDYSQWKAEQDELSMKGIEGQFQQLEQARLRLNGLRDDVVHAEEAQKEFAPEARVPAEVAKQHTVEARVVFAERDRECQEAQRSKLRLDGHREQRQKLGELTKEVARRHSRLETLVKLLGRDRLQRFLVMEAERQIVDRANAVLDRLSGGQLFLRLIGGTDDSGNRKSLDLECVNRTSGAAPIQVAFLSGSQKFRVAVSLALGIGQYASRQHRPIESVIIDEGFGCLDRVGRLGMIQELQNLRGQLKCILLVSHQEEFAEAFGDGYKFELQDGATRVERVGKLAA